MMSILVIGTGILWFISVFFAPSIIAFIRGSRDLMQIIILNLFLSFTIIGYAMALIWSFSENIVERRIKMKDWQIFLLYLLFLFIGVAFFIFGFLFYDRFIM